MCWATHQVALPVDVTEARIEVGHVLLFNFDQSMEHVCYMLVEHFGGTMIVHASDIVEQKCSQCLIMNFKIYYSYLHLHHHHCLMQAMPITQSYT